MTGNFAQDLQRKAVAARFDGQLSQDNMHNDGLLNHEGVFIFYIIQFFVGMLINLWLYIGAAKRRKWMIIVWLVTQMIALIVFAIGSIGLLLTFDGFGQLLLGSILFALLFVSSLYFWMVVWSFYKDLGDLLQNENHQQTDMGLTGLSGNWRKTHPTKEWTKPIKTIETETKPKGYRSEFSGNWRKDQRKPGGWIKTTKFSKRIYSNVGETTDQVEESRERHENDDFESQINDNHEAPQDIELTTDTTDN